jgi:diguanylate cyclase (GGDEF)-like protein
MIEEITEARMFAALSATNEAILRTVSQEELYQRVCDAAVYGGGFKKTGTFLAHPDNSLRAVAGASEDGMLPNPTISVDAKSHYGQGLAGIAYRTGRSCISNDVLNDERLRPWHDDYRANGLGSAVTVPILRHGSSIGVFLFCQERPGSITDRIVGLLERMVENVSFALDNFEKEKHRKNAERVNQRLGRVFAALSATNEAILRSSTADEMLQKVTNAAVEGGKFLGAAIFLQEMDSTLLRMQAGAGPFVGLLAKMHLSTDAVLPDGQGPGGIAFRSNKPCISNDITSDIRFRSWWPLARTVGVTTCAALPISARAVPIGVVYFFLGDDYGQLDEEAADLMGRMAENVSFGLEMFERERQRRLAEKQQENLNRMYVALSATNEAIMRARTHDELFELVCDAAVLGGKFTSTSIALAEPGAPFLRTVTSKGQNADRVKSTRFATSADHPAGRGLTGTSFRTRQPCIINDFLADERTSYWHDLARGGGTLSGASFPLLKGSEAIGVLLFLSSEKDTFTDELVELLGRLAENVSFALENFDRESDKKQAEERIRYLATNDSLTGLPNRTAFAEHLATMFERAAATREQFALLSVDLDRFKEVNDVFGHGVGDGLLCELSRRLEAAAAGAFVARLGGDEFALVSPHGEEPATAEALAGRLLAAIADNVDVEGHPPRIGISIGIAIFPNDGLDSATLTANADAALYRAKAEGRGTVRFFEADMDKRLRERRALQHDLQIAVGRGELIVHYQPQARIHGEIIGFEALARWQHPSRGFVPPGIFIPLAEESGLILSIGEWILREACREAASWPKPLQISINLSPVQFRHGDLLGLVHSVLLESGLTPNRLELEITEGVLIGDHSRALSILRRLKSLGVQIAMDDFGTGYSSLSYLQSFPFDKIKIDRTFISNVDSNQQSAAIVRAVISLARGLDLPVLAEGVETNEQLAFLGREACDEVQGYLVGRPCPIDDYANLVGRPILARAKPAKAS